jgi:hypothetical protein
MIRGLGRLLLSCIIAGSKGWLRMHVALCTAAYRAFWQEYDKAQAEIRALFAKWLEAHQKPNGG